MAVRLGRGAGFVPKRAPKDAVSGTILELLAAIEYCAKQSSGNPGSLTIPIKEIAQAVAR